MIQQVHNSEEVFFLYYFALNFLVLDENNINVIPATPPPTQQRPIFNVVDENSNDHKHIPSSPIIDEARTNISSSIGPAASTPSPSSSRNYKPASLTSTTVYFKTIQQQNSSPILQAKTIVHNDDEDKDNESITIVTRPRTSSIKHGEKKDIIATVRFSSDTSDENGTNFEETYL
jgi:hypothetical protein